MNANAQFHPAPPHHWPFFITSPGETDVLVGDEHVWITGCRHADGALDAVKPVHTLPLRIQALLLPIKTLVLSGY